MDQKDLLRKEIRQLEIALLRSTTSHCSQSPGSGKGEGSANNNADVNVKPKSPLSSGSRALAQKAWRERHEAERAARALAMSELEQRAVLKVKLKNAQAITKLRSQQANRRKIEHHEPSTLADSIELSSPLSITAVEESAAGTLEAAVKDLNKAIEESRDANQSEALSLELKTMDESNTVAENSLSVDNDDLMHSSDINSGVADTLTSHSRWEKIKTNLSNVVLSTKGGFDLEAITTESSEDKNEPALVLSSLSSMKLSINLENEDEEPFQFVPAPIPSPPPPPPLPQERLSSKKARSLWAVIRRNIGNISVASQGGFDALQSGLVASQSSIDLLEKINSSSPAVLNDEEDSESSAGTDEILAMLP